VLFILVNFSLPCIKQVNASCSTVDLYPEGGFSEFQLEQYCNRSFGGFPQQTHYKYQNNPLNKAMTAFVHFLTIHYLLMILQFSVNNFLRTDIVMK
jgi:hypothetical protein